MGSLKKYLDECEYRERHISDGIEDLRFLFEGEAVDRSALLEIVEDLLVHYREYLGIDVVKGRARLKREMAALNALVDSILNNETKGVWFTIFTNGFGGI